MKKLIQEIIKNIHHFSSLDVLNEIEHLAKEFYFIESIQPPLFWGGNDFEEDVSKALVFTKSEYNCELTRLNSFIEVRALPLEVLISKIRTSRVFEYTNNGHSQIVSKNYFTPLNGFSVDEIAEISEVKSGGIWRSKSNHDRTVIRRVSG